MSLDVALRAIRKVEVYESNITHNLTEMAEAAGIYKAIWRPEEINIKTASELVPILEKGLTALTARRGFFEKFEPSNGWGSYEGLVTFVTAYLQACKENPDAEVSVDR